jgi:cell division protein FtsB
MNDEKLENILRHAPQPGAPDGLLERLQRDVRVPHRAVASNVRHEPAPWLRRWLPAVGVAAILLSCVFVLAVQNRTLVEQREQNRQLKAGVGNLDQLSRENLDYRRLLAENQELDRLRTENRELQQLRAEVASLRAQIQEIDRLRAENRQLTAATKVAPQTGTDEEFFARVGDPNDKALRIQCVNNLKQIGLAARIWANDNNDVLPPGWLAMSNELSTPKILVCPAEKGRTAAPNWTSFSAANLSYEYLNPGGSETDPSVVLARCPIHNNVCLSDGSVQQLSKNRSLTMRDGRYYISESPQP